jgi:hypothetical protein
MFDASFVAAVPEGFEGTLDEVVGRVASPELIDRSRLFLTPIAKRQPCIFSFEIQDRHERRGCGRGWYEEQFLT